MSTAARISLLTNLRSTVLDVTTNQGNRFDFLGIERKNARVLEENIGSSTHFTDELLVVSLHVDIIFLISVECIDASLGESARFVLVTAQT